MSSVHNILIVVKQTGLDQAGTAIKGLSTTSTQATKGVNALGGSFGKAQGGALRFSSDVNKLGKEEKTTTGVTNQFGKSVDQAGNKTGGFAQKFQGNKGAIFAFVGMGAAGMEAVGMFGMYQSAADKLSEAQERVNMLVRAGAEGSAAHKDAVSDVADAQRGYNFILRNVAMSFGDIIPFTLLAVNAIVKMKDTVAGSKGALDAASAATTGLGTAAKTAASTGFTPMATTAGQLTGGLTSLGTGIRNTSMETGKLYTSSGQLVTGFDAVGKSTQNTGKFIGTKGTGLVGGISALSLGMTAASSPMTKLTQGFGKVQGAITSLPGAFTTAASGIASFFTGFAGNMTKFGSILKTAGTAAIAFGKTMLVAVMSNPITLAIAAISGAILALATDFLGIRSAINNAGVAIGNAIPPLKGLLQGIGGVANGALDYIANMMGVETQTQKTGKAAATASVEFDPLLISLQKYIDLGSEFSKLDQVVTTFANIRTEITKVGETFDVYRGRTITNLQAVDNAFTTAMANFQNKSPQAATAIQHVYDVIKLLETGQFDATKAQEMLNLAMNAASRELGNQVTQTKENINTTTQNATITEGAAQSTSHLSQSTTDLVSAMVQEAATGKGLGIVLSENQIALQKWLASQGITITTTDSLTAADNALIQSLIAIAPALETEAQNIALLNGTSIDWTKTLGNMVTSHQDLQATGEQTWNVMKTAIDKYGVEGLEATEAGVTFLEKAHHPLAETVRKLFEDYKKHLQETGQHVEYLGAIETERAKEVETWAQKEIKALQETKTELISKAQWHGIADEIAGKSLVTQQTAIKVMEEEQKSQQELVSGLQEMALARGMDEKALTDNTTELLNHIKTNNLLPPTLDEINAATGELIGKRQEDAKETQIQEQAYQTLLKAMGSQIDTTNLSVSTMDSLVKTYDDITNATQIATGEVATWNLELEKEEKINAATITALEALAKKYGITIPDSINKSIPKMKEFIKQELGIGDAAEESADKANKAFDSIANKAASALGDLINEDLIKGDFDDVIDKIEETGGSIDTLASKQAIIKPFLDDKDFTNDLVGLDEILTTTWADQELKAKGGGTKIVNALTSGMLDHLGEDAQPVVDHINQLWEQISRENPNATGAELIQLLLTAIDNPSAVLGTAQKLGQAVPQGVQSGAAGLGTALDPALKQGLDSIFGAQANFLGAGQGLADSTAEGYATGEGRLATQGELNVIAMLQSFDPAAAEAFKKAQGIVDQVEGGYKQGEGRLATQGELNTIAMLEPFGPAAVEAYKQGQGISDQAGAGLAAGAPSVAAGAQTGINQPISQNMTLIPNEAQTAIAPIEGVFSTEFMKASATATGVINLMLADITLSFGYLKENIAIKLGEITTDIQTFGTNVDSVFGTMDQKIVTFVTNTVTNFGVIVENLSTLLTAFADFGTGVDIVFGTMDQKIATWGNNTLKTFELVAKGLSTLLKGFADFGKGVDQVFGTMDQKIKTWASNTDNNFNSVDQTVGEMDQKFGEFWDNTNEVFGQMDQKIGEWASNTVSNFDDVGSAAEDATSKIEDLQSAINALKDKTITVTVNLTGSGVGYLAHGGSSINFPTSASTSFAAGGKTWLQKTPKKIGNTHVSERFPEIISAIPLDPKEKASPFHNVDVPMQGMPTSIAAAPSIGGGGMGSIGTGSGQPVHVSGNLSVTVTTKSGAVLAKEIQPYMLEGYSGIT
jgi:hypothetical protein